MIVRGLLYRLTRIRKPRPEEIRAWREGLRLSVTAAGQTLNLSNPSVTMRAYEREGTDRCPAAPTVAYMDTLNLVVLALMEMQGGSPTRAQEYLLEALPVQVRDQLYNHADFPGT